MAQERPKIHETYSPKGDKRTSKDGNYLGQLLHWALLVTAAAASGRLYQKLLCLGVGTVECETNAYKMVQRGDNRLGGMKANAN